MREGVPRPSEEVLARVERGEISPADALGLLGRLPGQVAPAARPVPAPPSPPSPPSPPAPKVAPAARLASPAPRIDASPPPPAPSPSAPAPPGGPAAPAALQELQALTGLGLVKELIDELRAFLEIQERRKAAGLRTEPQSLHMVFRGNPGTGKTTVARIVARLFKEMGLLEKGHLVEVERADLVGEYIGHTAQRVREQVKRALGGVLFVDEAYSLARGGEKDFGREAIDALVKAMEDHRHNLVLILAGYRDEMEGFLQKNPGLRSRFPIHIDFPDYSVDELLEIAQRMAADRDYRLGEEARRRLREILSSPSGRVHGIEGNARFVRNLIERAVRRQAVRLVEGRDGPGRREDLMLLAAADLDEALAVLRAALPAGWGSGMPPGLGAGLPPVLPLPAPGRGAPGSRPGNGHALAAGAGRVAVGSRRAATGGEGEEGRHAGGDPA